MIIFFHQQLFYLLRTQQVPHPLELILVPGPKFNIGIASLAARASMHKPAQGPRTISPKSFLRADWPMSDLVAAGGTSSFILEEE
jgi:hypothetical protein